MDIRTVTTTSSIWKFDLDNQLYIRIPRDDDAVASTAVSYSYAWEPYLELHEPLEHEHGVNRLLVVRPVPYGAGRLRVTGDIVSDSHAGQRTDQDAA